METILYILIGFIIFIVLSTIIQLAMVEKVKRWRLGLLDIIEDNSKRREAITSFLKDEEIKKKHYKRTMWISHRELEADFIQYLIDKDYINLFTKEELL